MTARRSSAPAAVASVPGSGCCRDAGSICSTPRRSISRSPISPMGWRASRAGTARPAARIFSRLPSIRCWSRPCCASRCRASITRFRLAALLHDAPEYVIGDMISPFKAVLGGDYKAVEKRLLSAIHIRFGLPPVLADEITRQIKAADNGAAYLEATRLAGFARGRGQTPVRPRSRIARGHRARLSDAMDRRQGREAVPRAIQGRVPGIIRDQWPIPVTVPARDGHDDAARSLIEILLRAIKPTSSQQITSPRTGAPASMRNSAWMIFDCRPEDASNCST